MSFRGFGLVEVTKRSRALICGVVVLGALAASGCRAGDLDETNALNPGASQPIAVDATNPVVVMSTDTLSGIRNGMKQMFDWRADGSDLIATIKVDDAAGSGGPVNNYYDTNHSVVDLRNLYQDTDAPNLIGVPGQLKAGQLGAQDLGDALGQLAPFTPLSLNESAAGYTISIRYLGDDVYVGQNTVLSVDSNQNVTRKHYDGIWFPMELDFPHDFVTDQHCDCATYPGGDTYGTFPDCYKVCSKFTSSSGCSSFDLKVKLNQIIMYVGLVPDNSPGVLSSAKWTTKLFPGAKSFVPSALGFRIGVVVGADPTTTFAFDTGQSFNDICGPDDTDICVGAAVGTNSCGDTSGCNKTGDFTLTCNGQLAGKFVDVFAATLAQQLSDTVSKALEPYLAYDGPYPPDETSCQSSCSPSDAACLKACTDAFEQASIGASMTYQVRDWLYGPFVGLPPLGTGYLPVTDITTDLTGAHESLAPLNNPGATRDLPLGTISFRYNPDVDGDGIPTGIDNCPNNPNKYQQNTDGDALGDACDPCPTNPDPNAVDYDGDKLCGAEDNCPHHYNPDQRDCNRHAEDELGIPEKGDACDPVPCADASADTMPFVSQYTTTTSQPLWAGDLIDWHGVQEHDVSQFGPAALGETEFAHCNCAGNGDAFDVDARIAACRKKPGTSFDLCSIANRHSYPGADGFAHDGSAWVAMKTQAVNSHCTYALDFLSPACPVVLHATFGSAYEYTPALAQDVKALWRPDLELNLLLPPGAPPVTDQQSLIAALSGVNGLTWAHTPGFDLQDLSTVPLATPSSVRPDANESDAASHYFIQDPDVRIAPSSALTCVPGQCLFFSWPDRECVVCGAHRLPDWLVDNGNVVVELSPRLSGDVTSHLDSTLLEAMRAPGLTLVPVSEPASILNARQNPLRAIAVDDAALISPGYIAETPQGIAGFGNAATNGAGLDPPHVFAASATTGLAYAVGSDGHSEQLTLVPVGGGANTTLPITGVDTSGTPLSVVYRYVDGQLYLLDEQSSAWWTSIRILRVDPETGAATGLAETPAMRSYGAMYLSVNDSGDLVLAASPRSSGSTLFTTLRPNDDGVEVTGWLVKEGTLLAPPDTRGDTGYSVVMRTRPNGPVQAFEIQGNSFHSMGAEHGGAEHGLGPGGHDHDHHGSHADHGGHGLPPWF